jgi:hypothetical protein
MDALDVATIKVRLEEQRDAMGRLEALIAQAHVATLRELRTLVNYVAIVVFALLAIAVGVWWR